MSALVILMLVVQVAGLLAAGATIVLRRFDGSRKRPVWSSLAIALVVIAATSFNIADKHTGGPGADIVQMGAGILLGMGVAMALMAIRERRGLDKA